MAADFFDDGAGDDEVGVGVLPLGSGLEVERLFGPGVEDLLRGLGAKHRGHYVVFGPVVLIAGGVGENLADGDFVAARESGNILAYGVIDAELALFLEQKDGGRGELLGDGTDGVAHVWRCRRRGGESGLAVGMRVDELATLDDSDGGGRDTGLLKNLRGDAVDSGFERGVERVDGLSIRGHGSERGRGDAGKQEGGFVHDLRILQRSEEKG